jgi:hypothetical protein
MVIFSTTFHLSEVSGVDPASSSGIVGLSPDCNGNTVNLAAKFVVDVYSHGRISTTGLAYRDEGEQTSHIPDIFLLMRHSVKGLHQHDSCDMMGMRSSMVEQKTHTSFQTALQSPVILETIH